MSLRITVTTSIRESAQAYASTELPRNSASAPHAKQQTWIHSRFSREAVAAHGSAPALSRAPAMSHAALDRPCPGSDPTATTEATDDAQGDRVDHDIGGRLHHRPCRWAGQGARRGRRAPSLLGLR